MSDWTPTDEMVETACRAAWEGRTGRKWGERSAFSDEARKDARNMLAAVGPMIVAGAWDEGRRAAVQDNLTWNYVDASAPESTNPYREGRA